MGWVAEKFKEHEDTKNHLDGLWNGLRDSCQIAVSEFVVKIDQLNVERRDCSARGKRCQRITKGTQFIEIFISESDQSVRSALGTDKEIVLAYYRLKHRHRCGKELTPIMKSPFDFGDKFGWRDAVLIVFGVGLFVYLLPVMFAHNHWWTLRAKLLGTFLSDLVTTLWFSIIAWFALKIKP